MKFSIDRLSVRGAMVLLMVLLSLPMIGLIAWSVEKRHEQAIARSAFQLSRYTATEAVAFERTLNESREVLQKLAQRPDIRALDPKRCSPVLGEIKELFPRYANVVAMNAQGVVVCSATPISSARPVSLHVQEWFAELSKSGGFSISAPHRGPLTGKWVLGLNQPIRDDAGRIIGFIGYSLDLSYQPLLPRWLALPEGLALTMTDQHGRVVIDSRNDAGILGKQFSDTLALRMTSDDAKAGARVIGTGEDQRLVAVSQLGNTGFRMYGIRPLRYVTQDEQRNAYRQLTIVTTLAGLSIMLALVIGRRFSLQIENMAWAVGLVAKGDLSRRIPAAGPTELVELAHGFNQMLDVRLQAEARYHSLFETSSDGILVMDTRSRIILANSRAHQIFGYAPGELVGQDLGILIPERSRLLHAQHVEQYVVYPVNRHAGSSSQARRKNGELFKCEINLTYLDGPDGTIISAHVHDLSQVESASRRYLTAIDTTIDGYAVLSPEGRFLEANSALAKLTGYKVEELCNMAVADVDALSANDQPGSMHRRFDEDRRGRFESVWRSKSGLLIDVELSYSHGEGGAIFCFVRDIRPKLQAQMALGMSVARIRNLERAINEHAIVVIVDEAENIRFVNDKYCAITQYPREELLGRNYRTISQNQSSRLPARHAAPTLAGGRVRKEAVRMMARDGSFYWVESTTVPFRDANGRHTEYFIIQTDITRQKQIEADLLHLTEQLRQLLARHRDVKEEERVRIAREIHDNLGGLLHSIRSHLSVALKEEISPDLSRHQLVAEAMTMAEQALESVRDIIVELRPSVLDQLGVWAAIESYAEQIAERSHLRCQVMIDPYLDERTLNDEARIEAFRIVQELMVNVVRHAEASMIEVEAIRMNDHVRITVADDGKGIDPVQIFGEHSWGIMGMYERARYCGGELKLTRSTNRGTTAVLTLPLEESHG
ncbi:MAG TPA: PAS domain S-box protein [Noviherbaspirillum sp.]|uniref:PAS domain S-box protein n=1 Tax=Noviherbaspirillum sp. TaxID=1926288 RepID=UPI002B49EF39|nr:PAS domain S-box protein [Noviherbaspirillum sp.]HJV84504.1 PAS domain S-box protein [Noviherbaspirillum sp.]